jgi:hypothetical protein
MLWRAKRNSAEKCRNALNVTLFASNVQCTVVALASCMYTFTKKQKQVYRVDVSALRSYNERRLSHILDCLVAFA